MIDFNNLRLKPIQLCDLEKDQVHSILYAKPHVKSVRGVIWYSTELLFSEPLNGWVATDRFKPSYYYNSLGTPQIARTPSEDWENIQLFSLVF